MNIKNAATKTLLAAFLMLRGPKRGQFGGPEHEAVVLIAMGEELGRRGVPREDLGLWASH